jgi:TPR repeat protein
VPQDFAAAKSLLIAAAQAGQGEALYQLGVMAEQGEGMTPNFNTGYVLFSAALASGYTPAAAAMDGLSAKMQGSMLQQAQTSATALWTDIHTP